MLLKLIGIKMKKSLSLFLSVFLYLQYSFGNCSKPVQYLTEGKPSPCTGYLFSPEQELEVRTKVNDYNRLLELTKKQDELITIQDLRLAKQVEINDNLRKQNQHMENTTMTEKLLWFGAGILLTGSTVYLLQRK